MMKLENSGSIAGQGKKCMKNSKIFEEVLFDVEKLSTFNDSILDRVRVSSKDPHNYFINWNWTAKLQ